MAKDYMKLIFTGNLGRDPEMRYMPNGQPVTNFNVASNNQYTNSNGEKVKETTWIRVSAFGGLAEVCTRWLKKGSKVLIEGKLLSDKSTGGPRMYDTDNGKRANHEVKLLELTMLGGGNVDNGNNGYNDGAPIGETLTEDDIPF